MVPTVAVALLSTGEVARVTSATMVRLTDSPLVNDPIVTVTELPFTLTCVSEMPVMEENLVPLARLSTTVTPSAVSGPELVTVMFQLIVPFSES